MRLVAEEDNARLVASLAPDSMSFSVAMGLSQQASARFRSGLRGTVRVAEGSKAHSSSFKLSH